MDNEKIKAALAQAQSAIQEAMSACEGDYEEESEESSEDEGIMSEPSEDSDMNAAKKKALLVIGLKKGKSK